jgi:hypothetical protein
MPTSVEYLNITKENSESTQKSVMSEPRPYR